MQIHYSKILLQIICFSFFVLFIAGCSSSKDHFGFETSRSLSANAITHEQIEINANRTLNNLFAEEAHIGEDITLSSAMARALLYNLEDRISRMEYAMATKQVAINKFDLLPQLAFNAGYTSRDSHNVSLSENLKTRRISTQQSTTSDRSIINSSLGAVWNVLDFSRAYVNSKIQTNEVLSLAQRKRQAMINIMNQVRYLFFQAWAAQEMQDEINEMIIDIQQILQNAENVEKSGNLAPERILNLQAQYLVTFQDLLEMHRTLSTAKFKLATFINLPPGKAFNLIMDEDDMTLPQSFELKGYALNKLEQKALMNRPEILMSEYNVRIKANEIHDTILKMLPSVSMDITQNWTSNSYTVNDSYLSLGIAASYNLLDLIRMSSELKNAKARKAIEEKRQMAFSISAIAALHISLSNYNLTYQEYHYAAKLADVRKRLLKEKIAGVATNTSSKSELFQARLESLKEEMYQLVLYAELNNALNQIYTSVGIDTAPKSITYDLKTMSKIIKQKLAIIKDPNALLTFQNDYTYDNLLFNEALEYGPLLLISKN